MKDHELMDKF
jgi:hypothetical protein